MAKRNDITEADAAELLANFDHSVAGVHLLDGPRPSYEFYSKAEWHTRGISQGLKIARTILEENLKLLLADAHPEEPQDSETIRFVLAQLRHAYAQLLRHDERWSRRGMQDFADGLIAPQIRKLEVLLLRAALPDAGGRAQKVPADVSAPAQEPER